MRPPSDRMRQMRCGKCGGSDWPAFLLQKPGIGQVYSDATPAPSGSRSRATARAMAARHACAAPRAAGTMKKLRFRDRRSQHPIDAPARRSGDNIGFDILAPLLVSIDLADSRKEALELREALDSLIGLDRRF